MAKLSPKVEKLLHAAGRKTGEAAEAARRLNRIRPGILRSSGVAISKEPEPEPRPGLLMHGAATPKEPEPKEPEPKEPGAEKPGPKKESGARARKPRAKP